MVGIIGVRLKAVLGLGIRLSCFEPHSSVMGGLVTRMELSETTGTGMGFSMIGNPEEEWESDT